MFHRKKGFTLIELLIVVAIIAILAAIAIPNFLEAQTRSKVSRVKSDMRTSAMALESFYVDHGWYPPDGFWLMDAWSQVIGAMPWVDNNCAPWFSPPTVQTAWDAIQTQGVLNLWRFDNCLFLTTPVAYLTSLPHDPFMEKDWWLKGSLFYGNLWDRWQYSVRPPDGDPNAQPYIVRPIDGAKDIDGRTIVYWGLTSAGPDETTNNNVRGAKMWTQYDPSNGTISLGDIYRIGP